jgi:large subunit ribosomal protein L23
MKKVLIKPHITEKTLKLVATENQYTFVVDECANQIDIRNAVSDKFGVSVLGVRILNVLSKIVSYGKKRITGRKGGFKKAIVTLKKGNIISDFDIK